MGSAVFQWEKLVVKPTPVGARRDVAQAPTKTLAEFECHISTLNPDQASHPPHTHPQEELIILRDGELEVHSDGTDTHVGPGSLFFFAANHPHAVRNRGDKPATYFVFNFSTGVTATLRGKSARAVREGELGSAIFEWKNLVAKPTAAGDARAVVDRPTATLANLECHVTTLQPGKAPHPPHRHFDEEIVLVKEGALDVTIAGKSWRAEAGSVIFVGSNDEHGWKNAAPTNTVYYVLRVRTDVKG